MDTGCGRMTRVESAAHEQTLREMYPQSKGVFTVGEKIEIRGSWFKVKEISPFGIKLKVLKGGE